MARLVRIERTGPYKIEPKDFPTEGKSIWICGCGLSETMPYCDKAHKACAAEAPDKLYTYDASKTPIPIESPPAPPMPPNL